jgi:cytochrome c
MRLTACVMLTALSFAALPAAAAPAASTPAAAPAATSATATEGEFGSKDEAVAMVKRVEAMFKKDGADATFKAVDDPANKDFHDRDLYPFIYNLSGVCVAHGARPALIGKNLIDIKDQDGKYLIREMVDLTKGPGSGWVNYKWPNPITNKIEDKSAFIEKLGDNYFVGVGVYKQ